MGRIVRSAAPIRAASRPGRREGFVPGATEAGQPGVTTAADDAGGDTNDTQKQADTYLERVAKYVPAEIVAFYLFVNSILNAAANEPVAAAIAAPNSSPTGIKDAIQGLAMAGISVWVIAWIVLIVALIMTPIYLISVSDPQDPNEHRWLNITVSVIAFPFWAYAIDALAFKPWHDGVLASIMLAIFTVISGAITPELLARFRAAPAPQQ